MTYLNSVLFYFLLSLQFRTFSAAPPVPMGEKRLPRDLDEVACGPIALRLAGSMLGIEARVEETLNSIDISYEGTSMADLAKAARGYGILSQVYRLRSIEMLGRLTRDTPAIVLLGGNHFALAWGAEGGGIWLAEYPKPLRRVAAEELAREADRRVLLLRRSETPDPLAHVGWWKWPVSGALVLAALFIALPRFTRRAARDQAVCADVRMSFRD